MNGYLGKRHIWKKVDDNHYISTINEQPEINDGVCEVLFNDYSATDYNGGVASNSDKVITVFDETVSNFNILRYHYVNMPLTIEAKRACEFSISRWNDNLDSNEPFTSSNFYYRTSTSGNWVPYTSTNTISLNKGDILQFKGDFTDHEYNMEFHTSKSNCIKIYGNPLSILDSENYATLDHFPNGDDDVGFISFHLFDHCGITFGYDIDNYPYVSFPFDVSNVFGGNLPV